MVDWMFRQSPPFDQLRREVEALVGKEWDFSRYGFTCRLYKDNPALDTVVVRYCGGGERNRSTTDREVDGSTDATMSTDDLLRTVRYLAKAPTGTRIDQKPYSVRMLEHMTGAQGHLHHLFFAKWQIQCGPYSCVCNPLNLALGYSNGPSSFEVLRCHDDEHSSDGENDIKYGYREEEEQEEPMHNVPLGDLVKLLAYEKLVKHGCEGCGAMDKVLSCCSRCHNTWYCGKKCQTAQWPAHGVVCGKV